MTRLALHASGDVPAVIKGHVIRQVIDLDPLDWCVLSERSRYLLNLRGLLQDLRVAVHAGARSGNSRNFRFVRC